MKHNIPIILHALHRSLAINRTRENYPVWPQPQELGGIHLTCLLPLIIPALDRIYAPLRQHTIRNSIITLPVKAMAILTKMSTPKTTTIIPMSLPWIHRDIWLQHTKGVITTITIIVLRLLPIRVHRIFRRHQSRPLMTQQSKRNASALMPPSWKSWMKLTVELPSRPQKNDSNWPRRLICLLEVSRYGVYCKHITVYISYIHSPQVPKQKTVHAADQSSDFHYDL